MHRIGAFGIACGLVFVLAGGAAHGLGFDSLVYEEIYDDLSLPTVPEVDALGFGGMDVDALDPPALTGAGAQVVADALAPLQGLLIGLSPLTTQDLGLRMGFTGMSHGSLGVVWAGGAMVFLTISRQLVAEVRVDLNLFPPDTAVLVVEEEDLFGNVIDSRVVSLSPTAMASIAGGGDFTVDWWIDRAAGTTHASVKVGNQTFQTSALALSAAFTPTTPNLGAYHFGGLRDAVGAATSAELELTRFQVFTALAPPAVPALSTSALALLGLTTGFVGATRLRRTKPSLRP